MMVNSNRNVLLTYTYKLIYTVYIYLHMFWQEVNRFLALVMALGSSGSTGVSRRTLTETIIFSRYNNNSVIILSEGKVSSQV